MDIFVYGLETGAVILEFPGPEAAPAEMPPVAEAA